VSTHVVVEKRSKVGPILWSAIALGCAVRALYRSSRAVADEGYAVRCPADKGCSPALAIERAGGVLTIYALTSGKAAVTASGVSIASDREPVVVSYGPRLRQAFVGTGADVGTGQALGIMDEVELSVTELFREPSGKVSFRAIEPASWLAARGLRISKKGSVPSALWCTHGRKLTVPKGVLSCGLRLPEPSGLLLLPVSVSSE
jgi:hypothetical protein